jgi:hypothetical protein
MNARSPARALLLSLIASACAACGGGLSGTYEEESGLGQLEFQDDGTVYVSLLGVTVAGEYELKGDRVIVKGPNGTQVLTKNGTRLEGGPGLTYVVK